MSPQNIHIKKLIVSIIGLGACFSGQVFAEEASKDSQQPTEVSAELKEKASYSVGVKYANDIRTELGEVFDLKMLKSGFDDSFADKKIKYTPEEMQQALTQLQQIRTAGLEKERQKVAKENLSEAEEFLSKNKEKSGVKTTDSGLQYEVLTSGKGEKPSPDKFVSVHYKGSFPDGKVFDSSIERDKPLTFPVVGVIPGWTEALQMMSVGDKWKVYVPPSLAYQEAGKGPIPPNQVLIFEIELLDVMDKDEAAKNS